MNNLCLFACCCLFICCVIVLSDGQVIVSPQYCTDTRTRIVYRNMQVCEIRQTGYGPRFVCYQKCGYVLETYTVQVCCSGYRSYPSCNVPICDPTCQNNALCIARNKCDCPAGYVGQTCNAKTCAAANPDCYPGSCIGSSVTCQCASGFSGINCETMKEGPEFQLCKVSFIKNGTSQALESAECTPYNENNTELYTNKRDFDLLDIHLRQSYLAFQDRPAYPTDGFLKDFNVGIINASVDIIINDIGGKQVSRKYLDCSNTGSRDKPQQQINCEPKSASTEGLKHKQTLDVVMSATTGGYKLINRLDGTAGFITKYFTGRSGSRKITFKFDLEPPYHCLEDASCCNNQAACPNDNRAYIPISTLRDITNSPAVTLVYLGWADRDSQLFAYRYSVYRMTPNGEGVLQEDEKPVLTGNFTLFDENDDTSFVLQQTGLYSIIGEVVDFASNIRYCRALVLYADTSDRVISHENLPMVVSGRKNLIGRHHWVHTPGSQVQISWQGKFENTFLQQNKLLSPVRNMALRWPSQPLPIDYTLGNISTAGTPNRGGITQYQYHIEQRVNTGTGRRKRDVTPPDTWTTIPDLSESYNILSAPNSGDGLTFWIRAHDVLGNVATDFMYLRVDDSAPVTNGKPTFVKDVGKINNDTGKLDDFYSSFDIIVADSESGIHKVDWLMHAKLNESEIIGSSSQPGQTTNECPPLSSTCQCTKANECFNTTQRIYVDNCLFVTKTNTDITFKAKVYNMANISLDVTTEIGKIDKLRGITEYPPPEGVRVSQAYGIGAILNWYLPRSCYRILAVHAEIKGGVNENPKFTTTFTSAEISNLIPRRTYTASVRIEYENFKRSEATELEFDTGDSPPPTGLSGGEIAGIVIGTLLLVLIVVIVILIVIRIRKKQPAIPRRLTVFGNNIKKRMTMDVRRSAARAVSGMHLNVAYNSGPKLRDFDDDIYVYGDMETSPEAKWKHSNDHVTIGAVIHSGKFAEIRKGTLGSKEGSRLIAVKILKEFSKEDKQLMKAKMNFLATVVPHHNNIVNFVGAVTEGPMILLELCEHSLRDWLRNVKKITDEVEDNMTNFCTDIARGMQHLHDNEIIHRRLGARNILLKNIPMMGRLVAKVTGFGPMKGEATGDDGGRIPVKYMAPEQLGLGKMAKRPYTYETDVWSFGMTVWEIYSRGKVPFAELKHSEIKGVLESGIRPPCPEYSSEELYQDIMMKCWQDNPARRPHFSELRADLERLFHGAPDGQDYYDDQYGIGEMYDQTDVTLDMDDPPPSYTDARKHTKRP